jgi:uncharacterized protein YuzE
MKPKYVLEPSEDDAGVAYVRVDSEFPSRVVRSLRVTEAIEGYRGPDVILDLDATGALVGIELVGDDES